MMTRVNHRLSFIKQFQQVAYIKPSSPERLIGSIIDIQGTEIYTLLNIHDISTKALIAETKRELISYSSGEFFVEDFEDALWTMRELKLFQSRKNREVSSISHLGNLGAENYKLSELHTCQLKTPSEAKNSIKSLRESLTEKLKSRGDKKLQNPGKVADQFFNTVIANGSKMYQSNKDTLYKKFVNSSGLDPDEIDSNWTIGELGNYASFKRKIKIIARTFNFDIKKALNIPPNQIPSWFIWVELDKKIKEEKYATGSNIIDKYLASLAFYADILVVDKRLKEYLKQIFQKNKEYSLISAHIIKLPRYEDMEKQLDNLNSNDKTRQSV